MQQNPVQQCRTVVMSPIWVALWTALMSLTWLVRPHFPPWPTLPAESWMALTALIGAAVLVFRGRSPLAWHPLTCLVGGLVLLPWLQFGFGLLPYFGQAWMASIYLFGLMLAMLVGAYWETQHPSQLAHALSVAICTAAIVSVGLQLYSWMGLTDSGGLGFWALGQVGSRPSANLGQPNQLATLLVWGLLGCLWGYLNKRLGAVTAVFVACFLLTGLSLTQSRTGMLSLSCIMLAIWYWRGLWPNRYLPLVGTGLYLLFFSYTPLAQWLNSALLLGQETTALRIQQSGELRLDAWKIFLHAILESPLFGYGWSDVGAAQLAVSDRYPSLGVIFNKSHNLFLELLLWCGVPIGLLISTLLIRWLRSAAHAIKRPEDAVLLMMLGAVGLHALVEFPLHYAYFLLPVGFVIGILNVRLEQPVVLATSVRSLAVLVLTGFVIMGITLYDYFKVDLSYQQYRLDQSILGRGREPMGRVPEVFALTHLREWLRFDHYKPHVGMSPKVLKELETAATAFPSPFLSYRVAMAMALNGRLVSAREWLVKICTFSTEAECRQLHEEWGSEVRISRNLSEGAWPAQRAK